MLINTQSLRDELITLFTRTKIMPKILITHNTAEMANLFTRVSQSIWMQRLDNLQMALHNRQADEGQRRFSVLFNENEVSGELNELLSNCFLEKYEELALKAKYDFNGFFPYRLQSFNSKMVIWEMLPGMNLTNYVLQNSF